MSSGTGRGPGSNLGTAACGARRGQKVRFAKGLDGNRTGDERLSKAQPRGSTQGQTVGATRAGSLQKDETRQAYILLNIGGGAGKLYQC